MKTIAEIRLDNLAKLIKEHGTQDRVAELGETSSIYLSQIKNQTPDAKSKKLRQMGDEMARKLELGCGKPISWMDNVHKETAAEPVTYIKHTENIHSPLLAMEPTPCYDKWTLAAIELLQKLDIGQRQAMVARMREYTQFLEPPRIGQAL